MIKILVIKFMDEYKVGETKFVKYQFQEDVLSGKHIVDDIHYLQSLVNGDFDRFNIQKLADEGIAVYYNKKSQDSQLSPSLTVKITNEDLLYGIIVFVGYDTDTGDGISLTTEQLNLIYSLFHRSVFKINNTLVTGYFCY
ncbi:MAG: hypothetical protein IJ192_08560 [Clostridia bacterium]|nr:hypothetical protein [Clostridia bacterium]